MMKQNFKTIGVMSGTSLDGVDICYCEFTLIKSEWSFNIVQAETIEYSDEWAQRLEQASCYNALALTQLDHDYGIYLGKNIRNFIKKYDLKVDFISVHGHTIFHQPEKGFTLQIGKGSHIAKEVNLPVINDFRIIDVAYGGQGAPLVPIGDELLFTNYDYCINLGGFANISFKDDEGIRRAFDICPCNMPLNYLSNLLGKRYDKDGDFARMGHINQELLNTLNALPFYSQYGAKSLGKEWFDSQFLPLIETSPLSIEDKLSTVVEHIAIQINNTITKKDSKALITGGGAYHKYLIERLTLKSDADIVIPSDEIVEYKEALVFAFLGVLRMRKEINIFKSVTGSLKDTSSGIIWHP